MMEIHSKNINKCYNKIISESPSLEGKKFMEQHKEIPFTRCKLKCDGYRNYSTCSWYVVRKIDNLDYGRLEDIGEDGVQERFKTYDGGLGN